jgi:uracil-DNA glycosylase family 4
VPIPKARSLKTLTREITACRACPRLVEWRESIGREKRASFRGDTYWAKPVPGWGDPAARVVLVGLAPAAHGGNRTGRVFTGDRSGDFLFASLHRTGFANQPESTGIDDGLQLRDAYVAAAVRCAPPANKPTPLERDECMPFLVRELELLPNARVIVVLGSFGYEAAWAVLRTGRVAGVDLPARRPRFAHGLEVRCGALTILGTYHPSQQNTFTGKLTPPMLDAVFQRARQLASPMSSPIP